MSLKHAILAVLSAKERTGYEITHKVDESVGFFWSASHQQIYRELALLEQAGLVRHKAVRQEDKPNKKVYRITAEGREELRNWIAEPTEQQPAKDALLIKLFIGHLVRPEVLLEELARHHKAHAETYRRYLEIEEAYFSRSEELPRSLKYQYLTLKRGIKYEKAWLAWAEETIRFLREESRAEGISATRAK